MTPRHSALVQLNPPVGLKINEIGDLVKDAPVKESIVAREPEQPKELAKDIEPELTTSAFVKDADDVDLTPQMNPRPEDLERSDFSFEAAIDTSGGLTYGISFVEHSFVEHAPGLAIYNVAPGGLVDRWNEAQHNGTKRERERGGP